MGKVLIGHSLYVLPRLQRRFGGVFMDSRGSRYDRELELMEEADLLEPGAVIVADNVLKPGAPLFLWRITRDPCFDTEICPVGEFAMPAKDWVSVSVYRSGGASAAGGARPTSIQVLEEELRRLLLECLPDEEEALCKMGFQHCTEYKDGHSYMEGYFHALPHSAASVESIHPRHMRRKLRRAAAPLPLRAFIEAVRRCNRLSLEAMQAELRRSGEGKHLADVLARSAHFADLSIQIHWGEEVLAEEAMWHVDAANSFLHMAVGLQGRRALHAKRARRRTAKTAAERLWQEPGASYVGSPCCYPHAVEYPEVTWDRRIVAVQCRLLLTEEEMFGDRQNLSLLLDTDPEGNTASIVFRQTEAWPFRLPGLAEVQAVMKEMELS
ncbi:unnamed protein product [Effrenium voratum]|uniref:Uncharacterized protein n=1 Tax=Effrenium voratum TaxID=2562239 RepID=A0AA36NBD9_9DINO|nr:unnamed protein product [Effrenium voratum]